MRTYSNLVAMGLGIAFILLASSMHGCCDSNPQKNNADATRITRDVTNLVNRWAVAFEARDLEGVRSVLAQRTPFVWLEDGEPRYRSVGDILKALESFPPNLSIRHALQDVVIAPMSNDTAWAHLHTSTKIEHDGRVVSEFTGVVLMIVQRDESGWRIHAAHTSTSNPRTRSRG